MCDRIFIRCLTFSFYARLLFHSISVGRKHHRPQGHLRSWIGRRWGRVYGSRGLQSILDRASVSKAETRQEKGADGRADQDDKSLVRLDKFRTLLKRKYWSNVSKSTGDSFTNTRMTWRWGCKNAGALYQKKLHFEQIAGYGLWIGSRL